MKKRHIVITTADHARLSDLIAFGDFSPRERSELRTFERELASAVIVAPDEVPDDVITINSRATLLDYTTDNHIEFTIVFPDEANIAEGKVSVLSPLGTGMLGYRVGDAFEWQALNGAWRLKVTHVQFRPEAVLAMRCAGSLKAGVHEPLQSWRRMER
ncbi:MAG: GreA/GreB family elongation factor [Chthoniobacter sp.]|uniref:GreA/GreB family elongation factor n=1 Tax=Chthoniobacter sp. TaxID=2510640 RepID=UPI0032A18F4F